MERRLQAHVLDNILANGGWIWDWNREIINNPEALAQFKVSNFTSVDYYTCTVMLAESSKIVVRNVEHYDAGYAPQCLTVDGVQYLKELRHPVREWLKRHWFATVVAAVTSLATVTATAFNVVIRIVG